MEAQGFDYKNILALILMKRWIFVGMALLIMTIAVITSYLLPKVYEAKSTVFIEKNVIAELVKGIAITPSMDQTIRVLKVAMTSRPLLQKVVNELEMGARNNSAQDVEATIASINKNINVTVSNDGSMFVISYRDANPRLARDFVNTLVRAYIEQNVSSKREESYGAIQFFSEQSETVRKKIELMDNEINDYKAKQGGIINIDEAALFSEINSAQQRLHELQLRRRQLEGLKPVARREADPLNNQLVVLERRQEELRNQFNENYPELIRIRGEIESLKKQISNRSPGKTEVTDPQEVARIEAELNALKVTENGLMHTIKTNQALLRKIPTSKAGLEQLEADRRHQKELYDQLLARQGQSEVSKQIEIQDKTTTYRIVEPAVLPAVPVSPNRLRIMMIGIFAGIAGGLGILIGFDYLNSSIKSVDTIKALGLQVLAIVPRIPDRDKELREGKRNRLLSVFSTLYFICILGIIAMEAVGVPFIDKIITRITSSFL
jgi:polysaccharide chain length determinant protein (PEP-CTERM system associated)